MSARVMIVEDEGLFRDMLRLSLPTQANLEVIEAVGDGLSAIRRARELSPDIVLMDIELGSDPNGIEAGIAIKDENPQVGIVLLSSHKEKEYISSIPLEKASGWSYLLKRSVGDLGALARAVEGSAAGLMVLDPQVVSALRPKRDSRVEALTARQREILKLIAVGYNNAAIAQKLTLNEKSVENYINAIYQELQIVRQDGVHPRVKATLFYLEDSY